MICGKNIYATQKEALDSIKGMKNSRGISKSNKRPSKTYFCDKCQGWHVYTENKLKLHHKKQFTPQEVVNTKRIKMKEFIITPGNRFKVK